MAGVEKELYSPTSQVSEHPAASSVGDFAASVAPTLAAELPAPRHTSPVVAASPTAAVAPVVVASPIAAVAPVAVASPIAAAATAAVTSPIAAASPLAAASPVAAAAPIAVASPIAAATPAGASGLGDTTAAHDAGGTGDGSPARDAGGPPVGGVAGGAAASGAVADGVSAGNHAGASHGGSPTRGGPPGAEEGDGASPGGIASPGGGIASPGVGTGALPAGKQPAAAADASPTWRASQGMYGLQEKVEKKEEEYAGDDHAAAVSGDDDLDEGEDIKDDFGRMDTTEIATDMRATDAAWGEAAAAASWPQLLLGRGLEKAYPLRPGVRCKIGRHQKAQLHLDNKAISREHCSLRWDEHRRAVELQNLSKQGTLVNGQAVVGKDTRRDLRHGDLIRIEGKGDSYEFLLDLRPVGLGLSDPREAYREKLRMQKHRSKKVAARSQVERRDTLKKQLQHLDDLLGKCNVQVPQKEGELARIQEKTRQRQAQDAKWQEQCDALLRGKVELEAKLHKSREQWLAKLKDENVQNDITTDGLIQECRLLQDKVEKLQLKKDELERTIHPERYAVADVARFELDFPMGAAADQHDRRVAAAGGEGDEEDEYDFEAALGGGGGAAASGASGRPEAAGVPSRAAEPSQAARPRSGDVEVESMSGESPSADMPAELRLRRTRPSMGSISLVSSDASPMEPRSTRFGVEALLSSPPGGDVAAALAEAARGMDEEPDVKRRRTEDTGEA